MAYMHIDNLYKNTDIMLFRQCYALEKIHGTSAHISRKIVDGIPQLHFFSGGADYLEFVKIFDETTLFDLFVKDFGDTLDVTVFGEAYGGKMQGMRKVYGDKLKFVAFEVNLGGKWLDVPSSHQVCNSLGLEFVDYRRIPTTLRAIDRERDRESVQAVRNGMGHGLPREGVVLRPLVELRKNNGDRIICKHKTEAQSEVKSKRVVGADLQLIADAKEIADEWVTENRMTHVLGGFPSDVGIESTAQVIAAMLEDVLRESKGEILESKAARKAICAKTATMFKERIKNRLYKLE
jgi:hypothetical protein